MSKTTWRPVRACMLGGALALVAGTLLGTAPGAGAATAPAAYGVGAGASGQLGDGQTADASSLTQVSAPAGVSFTDIAAGGAHAVAVGSNGQVYAWGDDSFGQLGVGSTSNTPSDTPVAVHLPAGTYRAVAAGTDQSYALSTTGTLYAWGLGSSGQLGDGNTTTASSPVAVNAPAGVTFASVAAGGYHAVALGTGGTVYAWGSDRSGQLGPAVTGDSDVPVTVSLPGGVKASAVAAGGQFSLALGTDQNLYAWGAGASGELGNGAQTDSTAPVAVDKPSGVTGFSAVAAGGTSVVALARSAARGGELLAWGDDSLDQLGTAHGACSDGTTSCSPVPIAPLNTSSLTFASIAAGWGTGYAVTTGGTAYAWGDDFYGQVGVGSSGDLVATPTIVPLPAGTDATQVSSGPAASFAFVVTGTSLAPSVTGVSPASGSPAGGTAVTITGADLAAATAVHFGATAATSFHVVSASQITATSPAGTGTVDVSVTTPTGTSTAVAADQFSYAAPYTPVPPKRLLDTRFGTGGRNTPLGPGQTLNLTVTGVDNVPAGATAAMLNVTVTPDAAPPGGASYLTVYPTGVANPPTATTSTLNFVGGQTVANLTEVGLGQGGDVSIYNYSGSTNVVVDLEGFVAPAASSFYDPLSPTRILDTRSGTTVGTTTPAVPTPVNGSPLAVSVEGTINWPGHAPFTSPVPKSTSVTAVVLNLTATGSNQPSWLTVWPAGQGEPTASNVNFSAGQTVPNRVVVPVGTGGVIDIADGSPGQKPDTANVVADVTGYFTSTATNGLLFAAAPAPIRLVNTRCSTPANPNTNRYACDHVVSGTPLTVAGTDTGGTSTDPTGIALNAQALEANVTVTGPTTSGWLTVWPDTTTAQPTTSDLNFVAGENVPNMDLITLGDAKSLKPGAFDLGAANTVPPTKGSVTTDVLVDVGGWYVPGG